MIASTCPKSASAKRHQSAAPGAGRAFLIFSLAYLLLLGQMPLVPLLMQVVYGEAHHHCAGVICYCKPGKHHHSSAMVPLMPATHAHGDHKAVMQETASQPTSTSLHTCGDEESGWIMLTLNKAFVPVISSLLPRPQPLLLLVPYQGSVPSYPVEDVFHPPRLG